MTKTTQEYVSINGLEHFFLHIKNDSDIVAIMLHGGPGSPNSYVAHYHEPYLDFANVIYYDQRGAGKTRIKNKIDPLSLSYDVLVEDLRQIIQYAKDKYQTDSVYLVGHSCGALLGTKFIAKYRHDVAGYIGYGQVTNIALQERSWCKHTKDVILKSGNKRDIQKINTVAAALGNSHITKDEYLKIAPLIMSLEEKYGYKAVDWMKIYRKSPLMSFFKDGPVMTTAYKFNQKLLSELYEFDVQNFRAYECPVYYILGRQDEWTTSTLVAEYFETITAPKKELYWIENAGHMMDMDNPSDFFATVKKIISH